MLLSRHAFSSTFGGTVVLGSECIGGTLVSAYYVVGLPGVMWFESDTEIDSAISTCSGWCNEANRRQQLLGLGYKHVNDIVSEQLERSLACGCGTWCLFWVFKNTWYSVLAFVGENAPIFTCKNRSSLILPCSIVFDRCVNVWTWRDVSEISEWAHKFDGKEIEKLARCHAWYLWRHEDASSSSSLVFFTGRVVCGPMGVINLFFTVILQQLRKYLVKPNTQILTT